MEIRDYLHALILGKLIDFFRGVIGENGASRSYDIAARKNKKQHTVTLN